MLSARQQDKNATSVRQQGTAVGNELGVNMVLQTLNLSGHGLGEVEGKAVGEELRVNTVLSPSSSQTMTWRGRGQGGGRGAQCK